MSENKKMIKSFPLAGTKNGTISVTHLQEPYGEGSGNVVSIGISLKGDSDTMDWKAHIPYENIDEVISALIDAKQQFGS